LIAIDRPLWSPGDDRVDRANLSRFMRFVREETGKADLNSYAPLYHFSIDQPTLFWTLLWDFVGIRASGERDPVLIDDEGMAEASWFPGVSLNFAQNLLRFDDERAALQRVCSQSI
jgi:acetoacetyl-CoA synthetase